MGRTNGKLKSFLKEALEKEEYINLVYDPLKIEFELYLPRYARHMEKEYERILKDWFSKNNRTYINYSNGKAVLKAAMKKSPYLLYLKTVNKKMFFRFSSFQEIEEKRKLQKDRQLLFKDEMQPSIASSDCSSGHDSFDSSPEPYEACDQPGNTDSDRFPHEDHSLIDKDVQVNVQENMNINSDKYSLNSNLEEGSTTFEDNKLDDYWLPSLENFELLMQNIGGFDVVLGKPDNQSDASNVYLEQTSIPEHTALNTELGSATEEYDFTLFDFGIKSENMASDQSVSAVDTNQPESALVNSQILASSPLVQIPEKQKFWICTEKRNIGSVVEYTCEPMSSLKSPIADLVHYKLMIPGNLETPSYVFIGSTLWESNRTMTNYLPISDGKYLLVFCE